MRSWRSALFHLPESLDCSKVPLTNVVHGKGIWLLALFSYVFGQSLFKFLFVCSTFPAVLVSLLPTFYFLAVFFTFLFSCYGLAGLDRL